MSNINILAKNTLVLSISQMSSFLIAFFYTIALARYLGSDGFGTLSFALAFAGIISLIADLGINTFVVKEVAKDKSLAEKYLGNLFIVKVILSLISLLSVLLIFSILDYPFETKLVIYMIVLSVLIYSLANIFNSIFQAYEKMEYQSFGQILYTILMFGGIYFSIIQGYNIIIFAIIYLISSLFILIFNISVCIWKFSPLRLKMDLNFSKNKTKEAMPFGVNSIFVAVYVSIDSVILSFIQGNQAVGWYSAAYKIVNVLMIIQIVSNIAIFPVMTKFHIQSKNSLKKLVDNYFKLMLIISFPLGVGITILSKNIILLIYGIPYTNSIIALQILIWSGVFTFLYTAFAQLFLSINKQNVLIKITGICMIENILLNLIFIPKFSYIGASFITVITEFTLLILIFIVSKNLGYGITVKQTKEIIKVLFATLVMGIFIYFFSDLFIIILIPMAILIYVISLIILKLFDNDELILFKKILKLN